MSLLDVMLSVLLGSVVLSFLYVSYMVLKSYLKRRKSRKIIENHLKKVLMSGIELERRAENNKRFKRGNR